MNARRVGTGTAGLRNGSKYIGHSRRFFTQTTSCMLNTRNTSVSADLRPKLAVG
jgi:hypothetical protein